MLILCPLTIFTWRAACLSLEEADKMLGIFKAEPLAHVRLRACRRRATAWLNEAHGR